MFEAFVLLCSLAGDGADSARNCRTALLPGYAAETQSACQAAVRSRPPAWLNMSTSAEPTCDRRPPATLAFVEVVPGLFVHRGAVAEPGPENAGDVSNIAFVVGASSIAAIDAGGSRKVGEELYLAIRAVSDLPISHLILTHMHPDHVFGAEPLREAGAQILGHANLPRALADRAETYEATFGGLLGDPAFLGSRIVEPDQTVSAPQTIDLGGRTLTLTPWPTAHTATDLTVLDEASGVLVAGDLLFDQHSPTLDGSLRGWFSVLADLKAMPARKVVPGHGGPLLHWPEGAEPLETYLRAVETDARAAIEKGLNLSDATAVIGQGESGKWSLFDHYNPRNATAAYTELEWE